MEAPPEAQWLLWHVGRFDPVLSNCFRDAANPGRESSFLAFCGTAVCPCGPKEPEWGNGEGSPKLKIPNPSSPPRIPAGLPSPRASRNGGCSGVRSLTESCPSRNMALPLIIAQSSRSAVIKLYSVHFELPLSPGSAARTIPQSAYRRECLLHKRPRSRSAPFRSAGHQTPASES